MSPRTVPAITHLQFLVLTLLRQGPRVGRHVRRGLAQHGVRRSAPAFYQMMARLEDAGLVEGDYDQKVIDRQIIKERRYTLTRQGDTSWKATRDFYVESIPELAQIVARQRRKGPVRA
jgi:DNA-binding PadR family transcriptional regulator